ncbi:ATP-binding cassette domain-containing protein [Rathayibacter toxicus]|nr:hypothetical protein C5D35_10010 [Rathayibacter toxicus]QWL27430.1 ATP-binding cassette domain-containing protein [Rathayibacter toxicus]
MNKPVSKNLIWPPLPTTAAPRALEARALSTTFRRGSRGPEVPVLHEISLAIAQGEYVTTVGTRGSGKSALRYGLSSLEQATSGSVHIDGEDVQRLGRARLARFRRERIGFIFPQFNLVPSLSAREMRRCHCVWPDAATRASGGGTRRGRALAPNRARPPQPLLGRATARRDCSVLAAQQGTVVADEPTGSLDAHCSRQCRDLGCYDRDGPFPKRSAVMIWLLAADLRTNVATRIGPLAAIVATTTVVLSIGASFLEGGAVAFGGTLSIGSTAAAAGMPPLEMLRESAPKEPQMKRLRWVTAGGLVISPAVLLARILNGQCSDIVV